MPSKKELQGKAKAGTIFLFPQGLQDLHGAVAPLQLPEILLVVESEFSAAEGLCDLQAEAGGFLNVLIVAAAGPAAGANTPCGRS